MNLPESATHIVAALILMIGVRSIASEPRHLDIGCDDIAEAMIYLYDHLPSQMAWNDRCKRYAVVLSHLKPRVRFSSTIVSQVFEMPEDSLNRSYERIAARNQLGEIYMTAIDGLREATVIGPPFLDLVECLKQLGDPSLQAYLDDEELNTIVRLYGFVQESPDAMIDLNLIPIFNRLRQGFVVTLTNMFKENIRYDTEVQRNLVRRGIADNISSSQQGGHIPNEDEMLGIEQRMKRARSRLATHRYRERKLLRTRRMKILSPPPSHDKAPSRLSRKRDRSMRCADIAEAITHLYKHYPDQVTLTDKCKGYAVLMSLVRPKAQLDKKTVHRVLKMPEDTLNRSYEELAAKDQSKALYMTAIDSFRASSVIGPPFLELIQCLKQYEDDSVRKYLEDEELSIILELYRSVHESPEAEINLNRMTNPSKLRRGFVASLMNLFKDHITYKAASDQDPACDFDASLSEQLSRDEEVTESERQEMLERDRRRLALIRHREDEVLRSRRMKILSPSLFKERSRRALRSNVTYTGMVEAISYSYEHLLDRMILADRCKRYAVILSYRDPMGRLHKGAVNQVLRFPEHFIDQVHQEFVVNDQLGAFYMTAIDAFRAAAVIGPPFLELIECLKQLDSPYVKQYLDGEELNIILDLYRNVLESPDTRIDLDLIPVFHRLRRGFVVSLMNIFRDHIRYKSAPIHDPVSASDAGPSRQPSESKEVIQPRSRDLPRRETKRLAMHRHREQNALRARRMRILSSNILERNSRSLLDHHQRVDKIIQQEGLESSNLSLSDRASSITASVQQQQRPSTSDTTTNQKKPARLMIDTPDPTIARHVEGARSKSSSWEHQSQQQLLAELSPRSPVQICDLIASPSDPSLMERTYDDLMDREMRGDQSRVGALMVETVQQSRDPNSAVQSDPVATSDARSEDDPNQLDVNDYLVFNLDSIDQNKTSKR